MVAAEDTLVPFGSSIAGKAVRIAFEGSRLTYDAGVLVLVPLHRGFDWLVWA